MSQSTGHRVRLAQPIRSPAAHHMITSDQNPPDVPEPDLLIEVSAHDALLRANDVVTAGAGENRLHT